MRCPDACATPESEKGCHFREGPDAFTCQKCKLRVLKLFIGYEITATDLDQLFRTGVTPDEKTLKRRDGSAFQARIMYDPKLGLGLAPKTTRQATDETCPKCGRAKLRIVTKRDGSKFCGCSGWPECTFTKPFVPPEPSSQAPNPPLAPPPASPAQPVEPVSTEPVTAEPASTEVPDLVPPDEPPPSILQETPPANVILDIHGNVEVHAQADDQHASVESSSPLTEPAPDKFQNLPQFLKEWLHIRTSGAPSAGRNISLPVETHTTSPAPKEAAPPTNQPLLPHQRYAPVKANDTPDLSTF